MSSNNKGSKLTLPDNISNKKGEEKKAILSSVETKLFGLETNTDGDPSVSLKYYQASHQCFSEWDKDELKAFSSFIEKVSNLTWPQIFKLSGCTKHLNREDLPKHSKVDRISKEIQFFELRVTGKARVHGFRSVNVFFLCWLDRNHEVYPE
ncbi:MAG6450 family protein [Dyadobacter sp. MSC1_007]|jgi:hypothetical protein|uniref:MAG6450 family protein n=1 Tax=Dyadobacter sp. MSC1_007 TaxID=2909264 RepID=UPI0020305E6B|nr:hypothetical protein [Dyadobacter sp. MSC1_007]